NKLYIESSVFNKLVSINENYIKSNLDINMSLFSGPLDIKYTRIANELLIYQSIFKSRLTLSFSKVHGETQLSSNNFSDDVDFFNIFFNDNVLLYQCLFKGNANFAHSTFNDNTNFNNNIFKKNANFNSVSFNKNISFKNTVFIGDATFENTLLPLHVDFSDVRIRGNKISLENTKPVLPGKKIHINIKNTDINKIDFNYNDFRLFFPKDTNLEDKLFIYSGLLKKYQRLGMNNSYKVLFREYREFKLLSENKYIANFVEKNWWNYGLNKEWVYSWFAIIISILTLLNGFFYDIFVSKYFNINFLKVPQPNAACQLNPILNYIYNLPRAAILTFFFVFATFLQVLANEDRIFKTDHFLVNTYVMLINCLGYIFIIFVLDIVTG
ncbi:MAG: pentapeptide repeat-containing protein, partial [Pseudomonadota bacterium]|nr:pentapeptide repeat-containing protein [Pseudomonadota bacterium]